MDSRLAGAADAPLLASMNRALIEDEGAANPMSLAELETRMRGWLAGEYRAAIFEIDAAPVGYALFRPDEHGVHLRQLFIDRAHRRRGLGREALRQLRAELWPACARISVEVLVGNARGLAFWRAVGFADHAVTLTSAPKPGSFETAAVRARVRRATSIDRLRTTRLALDRLRARDLDDLARLHADPQVAATLGGVRSPAQTEVQLRALLAHWDEHGFGIWSLRDLSTGRFAGRGGLQRVAIEGRDEVEVSYALRPELWGRGLATEVARESVRVAFEVLGLAELVCFTLTTNHASQRVMAKAGFRYERDIEHAGLPHVLHRLAGAARTEGS